MGTFFIDVNSFDINKLKELRNVLENNLIEKLDYDLISRNYIKFSYSKRRKINFKYKIIVNLIRNKYYRKLLNSLNELNGLNHMLENLEKTKICPFNLKYCEGIILLEKLNNYKKIIKEDLINYIGVYNFDYIIELSEKEMIELSKYNNNKNNKNNNTCNKNKILGMYCKLNLSEILKLVSNADIEKIKISENYNKIIFLCPELIKEFAINNFNIFKKHGILDSFQLYEIIFYKVLVHEIGHGVFDYIFDKNNERRANYFASLTFDGTFDILIKEMTDIQGGEYKNPYLISDEELNISKEVYNLDI